MLRGEPHKVAPKLLGSVLVVDDATSGTVSAALIVEVEAYEGSGDPASHAANGRTKRNVAMFGDAGGLYVYRSYGIHWCANIICGREGEPGAVLVRAGVPIGGLGSGASAAGVAASGLEDGLEYMWKRRRAARVERDLMSGPGKFCEAMAISGSYDGVDLLDEGSPVRLYDRSEFGKAIESVDVDGLWRPNSAIVSGPRIGISKAKERPWRFGYADDPFQSKPRLSQAKTRKR